MNGRQTGRGESGGQAGDCAVSQEESRALNQDSGSGDRVALGQEGNGRDLRVAELWEARVREEPGDSRILVCGWQVLPTETENVGGEGDLEG